MIKFEVKSVPLNELYLDPNNYRLLNMKQYSHVEPEKITDNKIQQKTLRLISGANNINLQDLLASFQSAGFLLVNQIQVVELDHNVYKVIEGNRRVAALKRLYDKWEKNGDIGELDNEIFDSVPVIVYQNEKLAEQEIIKGLQHIGGVKSWPAWNQALYMRDLIENSQLDEKTLSQMLGISALRLKRAIKTLALIDEYRHSEYGSQFEVEMYTIFEEVIKNPQMRNWIGWDDFKMRSTNTLNRDRLFSWLSEEEISDDDDDEEINFKTQVKERPIITKYTDIRELRELVDNPQTLDHLETTRSIRSATAFQRNLYFKATTLTKNAEIAGRIIQNNNINRKTIFDNTKDHFTSIEITNFKQLVGLKINNLNRINIFAGINNAGKTSLLEAVYLLTRLNDIYSLFEVYRKRGKFMKELDPVWFDNQFLSELAIRGRFNGDNVSVSIFKQNEEDATIDKSSYISSVFSKARVSDINYESKSRLYKNKNNETFFEHINLLCNSSFSSPFSIQSQEEIRWYHEKSVENKNLDRIITFLRDNVDQNIEDIQLAGVSNPRFFVSHRLFKDSIDLTQFGEGIQRIFQLSLMFASAENGVLFIDELENAIHHSLLDQFTLLIEDLAERFNVQVFITSHSKECINAFLYNGPNNNNLSAYRLEKNNENIDIIYVPGEELLELVISLGVDLRGES